MSFLIYLQKLHGALTNKIPQVEAIIQILTQRSSSQRQECMHLYEKEYGEFFLPKASEVFYGYFREVLFMLCRPGDYTRKCRHLALQSDDECIKNHAFHSKITDKYHVDWSLAYRDAKSLTLTNKDNIDSFRRVVNKRPYFQQLAYHKVCEKLKISSKYSSTSPDVQASILMNKGLNDLPNLHYLVVYCIVFHSEGDMKQIKQAYKKNFKATLKEDIQKTCGSFTDTLMLLFGEDQHPR